MLSHSVSQTGQKGLALCGQEIVSVKEKGKCVCVREELIQTDNEMMEKERESETEKREIEKRGIKKDITKSSLCSIGELLTLRALTCQGLDWAFRP